MEGPKDPGDGADRQEERRSSEEDAKDRARKSEDLLLCNPDEEAARRRQKLFHKNSVINVYQFNLYFLASGCIKLP